MRPEKIWPSGFCFWNRFRSDLAVEHNRQAAYSATAERIVLLLFSGLWLALFWNNARLLPFHVGFDSPEHLKYISTSRNNERFRCRQKAWRCISRRSIT